jgi:hypothetical protein
MLQNDTLEHLYESNKSSLSSPFYWIVLKTQEKPSLQSSRKSIICNSIRLTKRVRFVDESGNMDSRVINEE